MRGRYVVLPILALVTAVTGCKQQINMAVQNGGKISVVVEKGDTLKWSYPVSFSAGQDGPCVDKKENIQQGEIAKAPTASQTPVSWRYTCGGKCKDPEIVVTSTIDLNRIKALIGDDPDPNLKGIALVCRSGVFSLEDLDTGMAVTNAH